MIGKNGESTFVKICLPLDESETAMGSDKDDPCGPRVNTFFIFRRNLLKKKKIKMKHIFNKLEAKSFFEKTQE